LIHKKDRTRNQNKTIEKPQHQYGKTKVIEENYKPNTRKRLKTG